MSEQSSFSKYSKKFLHKVAEELFNTDFDYDNPYNDDIGDQEFILKKILKKYLSQNLLYDDVEFFAKFCKLNFDLLTTIRETKDKTLIENLEIPKSETYNIDYWVKETVYKKDFYSDEIESYDKTWVRDKTYALHSDGSWSIWEGVQHDSDTLDSEFDDWEISSIELKEKQNVRENHLKKTQRLISVLDRKTLLEVKEMIDRQLKLK